MGNQRNSRDTERTSKGNLNLDNWATCRQLMENPIYLFDCDLQTLVWMSKSVKQIKLFKRKKNC